MLVPEPKRLCNMEFAKYLFDRYSQRNNCCLSCEEDVGIEVDLELSAIECPPEASDEGTACESGIYYQPLSLLANYIDADPSSVTEKSLSDERYKYRPKSEIVAALKQQQKELNKKHIPCFSEKKRKCPPPICITPIQIESDLCGSRC